MSKRLVVVVFVVVDSHIQRIVLATEETTVTQQLSHRPIKCQYRLWSQRCAKVNGSHHGDNPLLRPTGIQLATKSYAALQAMAPTNIKTVHQTSLLHIESNLDRLGIMLSPTHDQRSQQKSGKNAPTSFDQQVQVSQGHTLYRNKKNWNTEVHGGGGLELVKPAREPASSRPKPSASLKNPHESCPLAAPCGPRRKKNDRGQTSAFPSETSRFKPVILAHRGSGLPWLVDDPAALRLRRIWCVPPPDRALPDSPRQCSLPLACCHPPEGHQIGARKRRAPGNTIILSQSYLRRVSTDRVNREGSQLAASLEGESGSTPAGKTLPHSYPETRFRRDRARDVRVGGIIGCKYKTSSWNINGFPYGGSKIGLTVV